MTVVELKQKIIQKLNNLDFEQLTLINNLLNQFTTPLKTEAPADPLASLRNSDFIGCISDDPDLAANSEAIAHNLLSQTGDDH